MGLTGGRPRTIRRSGVAINGGEPLVDSIAAEVTGARTPPFVSRGARSQ